MFNTIYVHAGLPKTGSTYLQNSLQLLSRKGQLKHVAYPVLNDEQRFSHIGSGNGVDLSRATAPDAGNFSAQMLEAGIQKILDAEQGDAQDLLISSEQFFFATAERFAVLKQALLRHCRTVKLVIAVRPLREWSHSVYMQLVKVHALHADYDRKWLDEYFGSGYFNCFGNLDRFDVEAIVFRYQDIGLLPLFLRQIGEDEQLAAHVPDIKVNRSLSADELEFLRKFNGMFRAESLSRAVSEEFVRVWPNLDSAEFPEAGEAHFQSFATDFAEKLAPFNSPIMTETKRILFADAEAPTIGRVATVHHDRDLAAVALECVSKSLNPYFRDAAAFAAMKKYAARLDAINDFFDPIHYLLMYPDVAAFGDPWVHFQDFGRKEGRKSAFIKKGLK